ncbi:MAG: response regulator [Planctomycetes bacterium]|nr:response regulator [Planctomycetota bacterium]MCB9892093.1 response regulator [Planctomycetota bacterium]MCB9920335.1 response regulator [Planctomycetota bacterium]
MDLVVRMGTAALQIALLSLILFAPGATAPRGGAAKGGETDLAFTSLCESEGDAVGGQRARWLIDRDDHHGGTIRDIFVDADETTWAATESGLVRYDGYEWATFAREHGAKDIAFGCVLARRNGTIVVGSLSNVLSFDPKNERFTPLLPRNPMMTWDCRRLAETRGGDLWVATSHGALRLAADGSRTLFGESNRCRLIDAETTGIRTCPIPDNLLDEETVSHGTGALTIDIENRNVVCEVFAGSAAEAAGIAIGDAIHVSPAPGFQAERIGYQFVTAHTDGRTTTRIERERPFEVLRRHASVIDILVDRGGSLWISYESRILRLPLDAVGGPNLNAGTIVVQAASPHLPPKYRLRPSSHHGAVWALASANVRSRPYLFSLDGDPLTDVAARLALDRVRGVEDIAELDDGTMLCTAKGGIFSLRDGDAEWQRLAIENTTRARVLSVDGATVFGLLPRRHCLVRLEPIGVVETTIDARSLSTIAADGTRWFRDRARNFVAREKGASVPTTYPDPFGGTDSSPPVWIAHSKDLAWAIGGREGRTLAAIGRQASRRELDVHVSRRTAESLQVDEGGDAWLGPAGKEGRTLFRFRCSKSDVTAIESEAFRLPESGTEAVWTIFLCRGEPRCVQDASIHDVRVARSPDGAPEPSFVRSGSLPAMDGAALSIVAVGGELWVSSSLGEIVRVVRTDSDTDLFEQNDSRTVRLRLDQKQRTRLARGADGSLWAVNSNGALRFDHGVWRSVARFERPLTDARIHAASWHEAIITGRIADSQLPARVTVRCDPLVPSTRIRSELLPASAKSVDSTYGIEPTNQVVRKIHFDARIPWRPHVVAEEYQHRINHGTWSVWSAEDALELPVSGGASHELVVEVRSRIDADTVEREPARYAIRLGTRPGTLISLTLAVVALLGVALAGWASTRTSTSDIGADDFDITQDDAAAALEHDSRNLRTFVAGRLLEHTERASTGAVERCGRNLIGQLHDINRDPRVVDVGEVVREVLGPLTVLVGKEFDFEIAVPDRPADIVIARSELVQILMNLVLNACDAMPFGGKISVQCRVVPSEHSGDSIVLEISDTGTGMDATTLANCFEKRFTTKGEPAHAGRGLATVRKIVDSHGGSISVESELGRGTTFAIRYPVASQAALSATRPARKLADKRILVCDDDPRLSELVGRGLRRLGVHVTTASASSHVIRLVNDSANEFAAIILDVQLDGVSGIDIARRFRRDGISTPIVLISGHDTALLREHARGLTSVALLEKPFFITALAHRLLELTSETEA